MSENAATPYRFVRLSESNFDELVGPISDLHAEYLGERCDPRYWRWRYLQTPGGESSQVVAFKDNRAIGKRGHVRVPMLVEGNRVIGAVSEGLYIRPSDRSWDCFTGLLKASRRENAKDKVALSFAISTPMAAPIAQRFGSVNLGPAPAFALSLAGGAAGAKGPADIRLVTRFDQTIDALWDRLAPRRNVAVIKDARYLNWRYIDHPAIRYVCLTAHGAGGVVGLAVFSIVDSTDGLAPRQPAGTRPSVRRGRLLELMARDDEPVILDALLQRALLGMRARQVAIVVASSRTDTPEAAVLRNAGFKLQSSQFWNVDFTVLAGERRGSTAARELKNWHISLGDWLLG